MGGALENPGLFSLSLPSKRDRPVSPSQVNLGDAVLRGLFSRWVDQYLRLGNCGTPSSRSSGGGGGHGRGHSREHSGGGFGGSASGRTPDNGSGDYSSGDSDSENSDRDRGLGYDSRSASPGSGLSSRASEGGGRGGVDDGARRAGSGSIRGNHVLGIDLVGGGGERRGGRAIGDDTVLWVTETDGGGSGGLQRTILHKRVGEFDGREVSYDVRGARRATATTSAAVLLYCCDDVMLRLFCTTHVILSGLVGSAMYWYHSWRKYKDCWDVHVNTKRFLYSRPE